MKIKLEDILKCIDDEPELPGEPPSEMKRAAEKAIKKSDIDFFAECLRLAVRMTKQGIAERVRRIANQEIQPI